MLTGPLHLQVALSSTRHFSTRLAARLLARVLSFFDRFSAYAVGGQERLGSQEYAMSGSDDRTVPLWSMELAVNASDLPQPGLPRARASSPCYAKENICHALATRDDEGHHATSSKRMVEFMSSSELTRPWSSTSSGLRM